MWWKLPEESVARECTVITKILAKRWKKCLISFQCLIKLLKYSIVTSSLFIISESFFATRVHDYSALHLIKNKSHCDFSVDKNNYFIPVLLNPELSWTANLTLL